MKSFLVEGHDLQGKSLPMRERGLKYIEDWLRLRGNTVAPHAGAWIEMSQGRRLSECGGSLPMRERGLKLVCDHVNRVNRVSLPMRERGLKLRASITDTDCQVAPHAGAWIEIW